jgi:hypothetical protein
LGGASSPVAFMLGARVHALALLVLRDPLEQFGRFKI